MNYRQVHLDFHTNEKIKDIGALFNKEEFQQALKAGYIDSITLFSKCHHGWAYHPSKANEIHPNLNFDLLALQIEAAHEINVKTPVYLSAGLDEKMARRHPEWLVRNKDETTTWVKNFSEPGYHKFCMNSPYLDYLLKQIEEVCEQYDADGIFLDIVGVQPCYCQNCIKSISDMGKDPYNEKNILQLAEVVYSNYTKMVREAIDKHKKGLAVFHNGGHIRRGRRDLAGMNTHLELESLPTGGWGYDHFPLSAAYARTLGMEFLGMTGKFHKSWGEFGGFKHPNALKYETALSVANSSRCSVGDQLHPSGKMEIATYKLIGTAYKDIYEKEEWLKNAENIADIAIFTVESCENYHYTNSVGTNQSADLALSDAGCTRMLLEGKYLFNAIDADEDFLKYKLIILPDYVYLDKKLSEKFNNFINKGGKILVSGNSALDIEKTGFLLDIGAEYKGEALYNPDYIKPKFNITDIGISEFIMYSKGQKIVNTSAEILAERVNPYFNRRVEHFSSHAHAPADSNNTEPGMIRNKNIIYIPWNIFEDYANNGSIICKYVVHYGIELLLGDKKTVKTNLPAQGIVTLTQQNDRKILHLLYAFPVKRGSVEVIEDILPVIDTTIQLNCDNIIKKVYLAPQNQPVEFSQNDGVLSFVIKEFQNHQMIVIE